MNNKHRRHVSLQTVPFSWEDMPGVSKFSPHKGSLEKSVDPPPIVISSNSYNAKDKLAHGPHVPVPPPPCPYWYQPNFKTKGGFLPPEEDPFLAAYIECTKTVKEIKKETQFEERKKSVKRRYLNSLAKFEKLGFGLGLGFGHGFRFGLSSCKSSCGVREGNLVKLPKFADVDYHVDELE